MKRVLAFLLAAALAAGLLAACGSNDGSNDSLEGSGDPQAQDTENTGGPENEESPLSGEIIVITYYNIMTELGSYAQEFMDANPGTTVTVEVIEDYAGEVAARIAGGEAPDIFFAIDSPDTYAEYFLPIDDLPFTAGDILGYEGGRGADGNLYALPMTVYYTGMAYNKALFAEAGITGIPTTMEKFHDVCDQLQAAGITALAIAQNSGDTLGSWWGWSDVNLRAGDARAQAKYVEQDLLFDDVMLASMDILRGFYTNVDYIDFEKEYDVISSNLASFAQGEAAMAYSGSSNVLSFVDLGAVSEEDIGMFPFPGAANVAAYPGVNWGISKDTENPGLAKAFLAYMLENPYWDTLPSSNVHLEVSDPFVAELLSYGVEALAPLPSDETFTDILEELEQELAFNNQGFFKAYIMEQDDEKAQAMVDEWNEKWAEIRKNYVE